MHLHIFIKPAAVDPQTDLCHQPFEIQCHFRLLRDPDLFHGIHRDALPVFVGICHVESYLLQFVDMVCIYLIPEISTGAEGVFLVHDQPGCTFPFPS